MGQTRHAVQLGELIAQEVSSRYPTQRAAADAIGVPVRSLLGWMKGEYPPRRTAQAKLEAAFGWRLGAMNKLLTSPDPDEYTLETLREVESQPDRQVDLRAVSDAELMAELAWRLEERRRRLVAD